MQESCDLQCGIKNTMDTSTSMIPHIVNRENIATPPTTPILAPLPATPERDVSTYQNNTRQSDIALEEQPTLLISECESPMMPNRPDREMATRPISFKSLALVNWPVVRALLSDPN